MEYYILAFLVVAIILAFVKLRRGNKAVQRSTVFIIGDCGSGKTALLYYVLYKNTINTTNSFQIEIKILRLLHPLKRIQQP